MFGQDHSIPLGSEIHLSKLEGGLVTTDTCNAARLLGRLLVDAVDQAVEERRQFLGTPDDKNTNTLQSAMIVDCHNHMRNVLIKAAVIVLSVYLSKVLADDLINIDWRLRVSTTFDGILQAIEKEFSLPAKYPKEHGDMFKHWLCKFHPGALLVPVQRTAGSRQDLAT